MRQNRFPILLFLLGFQLFFVSAKAQQSNTLDIMSADLLEGAIGFERLIGSVQMKAQNSLIYCDSAHFFRETNQARLFGNVRIVDQTDPIQTKSAYAEYDGNTKIAKLRTNVVFTNQNTTLYTQSLDYDRSSNIAYYNDHGKVVDSVNVLTSKKGTYEVNIEKITFQEEVVLVNPDYTMKTGFLVYLTIPKTVETQGLTNVVSAEGNTLDAQKGTRYDTQQKHFQFFEGIVETENSRVKGEELFYDEPKAYYKGEKNVSILNKKRDVEVFGDEGQYWEDRRYSIINGNALVRKYFERDTLYLTSDSLISQDNEEDSAKYLLAFRSIQLIKSEISGLADSLVYNYTDSSIRLFQNPIIWNRSNQISADSMVFFIANEELERVFMKDKAFSITQDTLVNFNQMKGRSMMAYFKESKLSRLDVDGNGESLYFALEGDTLTQGINKTLSATIKMIFEDGVISKVNYGIKPDGSFTPVQKLSEESSRLEGFRWRIEEKPKLEDIHAWRRPDEIDLDAINLFDVPEVKLELPLDEEIEIELKKKRKTN